MERYKEYKDSGVQWIGEIPVHWDCVQFRGLFNITKRIAGKTGYDVLAVTQKGIKVKDVESNEGQIASDYSKYQLVDPGDFAMNHMDLLTGFIGISPQIGVTSPDYRVFKNISSKANSKFYLFLFEMCYKQRIFYGLGHGVSNKGRWRLPAPIQNKFCIPLPPVDEQEKIVDYIESKTSKIDEYIAGIKTELDLYKELIESIIFSKDAKDSIIFTSWEDFFDNTWKTELGKGLFDEIEIKGVSTERFLAVTQDKGLIYKDVEGVNFVTAEKKETQKLVSPGEFVISLRSFEGGIEYSTIKGLVSPAYVVLRLKEKYNTKQYQMYFRFLFKSVPFVSRLNSISDSMRDGKAIKFSDIKRFPFPIPSDEKLKEIAKLSNIYDIKKKAVEEKIKLLDEYKQRLIADCVTGQVNVQNE